MKNKTLAAFESFTGGSFASDITKTPGASIFFKGSIVMYNNDVKETFGINTKNGVVNQQTALDMSQKCLEFFNVDTCVAFTGNAGPQTMDNKQVGEIYIAINKNVYSFVLSEKTRKEIIDFAVDFAKEKIKIF